MNLYRETIPHEGFAILKRWSDSRPLGSFVFTSNVDGQFQKAGFAIEKVVEAHGSIHHLQCMGSCRNEIFAATDLTIDVDQQTMRAKGPLPKCPCCRILARPNILMFRDSDWNDSRSDAQSERFHDWQESLKRHLNERGAVRLAIVELGAGGAIATVRHTSERLARDFRSPLIRINPREHEIPDGGIGIPLGSAHSLKEIDQRMRPRL